MGGGGDLIEVGHPTPRSGQEDPRLGVGLCCGEHLWQQEGPLHVDPRYCRLQGRYEEEGVATVRRPHGRCGPQVDHREDGADVTRLADQCEDDHHEVDHREDRSYVKQDLQILQVLLAEWVRCNETCRPTQQAMRTLSLQRRTEPSANINLVKTHYFIGDITI